jgi:hypothetical protein
MSDDCLNDGCFRPVAAGKKHDQFLDVPDRPYLSLTTSPSPATTTVTPTTTTGYPQDILDIIHIPTSGKPCPVVLTTTTTTTTTQSPIYAIGGLKAKFNMSSSSSETFEYGDVNISVPITNGIILSNIDYSNVGNNYSFIAFGYFKPPINGPYRFYTTSNYRSAIWFDTLANSTSGRNSTNAIVYNTLISSTDNINQKIASASRPLLATKYYPIRLIYSAGTGFDSLKLSWSGPNIPETTNLSQYFYYQV